MGVAWRGRLMCVCPVYYLCKRIPRRSLLATEESGIQRKKRVGKERKEKDSKQ